MKNRNNARHDWLETWPNDPAIEQDIKLQRSDRVSLWIVDGNWDIHSWFKWWSLCVLRDLSVSSGIFTAPTDGRYLLTAVLTAQRGEKVEAVLSVSNRSVQKLDSMGFLSGAASPPSHGQCNCSSSTSLSLVLPLRRGDRVGLVQTAGKLAASASSEILSSFSAVLLYPSPSKR